MLPTSSPISVTETPSLNASPVVGSDPVESKPKIDIGVLFADEATYFVLTPQLLGLKDSDDLHHVECSCDCLVPSLVTFRDASSKVIQGVRFDFLVHDQSSDVERSQNLGVEIQLILEDGSMKQATLLFLLARNTRQVSGS